MPLLFIDDRTQSLGRLGSALSAIPGQIEAGAEAGRRAEAWKAGASARKLASHEADAKLAEDAFRQQFSPSADAGDDRPTSVLGLPLVSPSPGVPLTLSDFPGTSGDEPAPSPVAPTPDPVVVGPAGTPAPAPVSTPAPAVPVEAPAATAAPAPRAASPSRPGFLGEAANAARYAFSPEPLSAAGRLLSRLFSGTANGTRLPLDKQVPLTEGYVPPGTANGTRLPLDQQTPLAVPRAPSAPLPNVVPTAPAALPVTLPPAPEPPIRASVPPPVAATASAPAAAAAAPAEVSPEIPATAPESVPAGAVEPAPVPSSPLYGYSRERILAAVNAGAKQGISAARVMEILSENSKAVSPPGVVPYSAETVLNFAKLGVEVYVSPNGGLNITPAIQEYQKLAAAASRREATAAQLKMMADVQTAISTAAKNTAEVRSLNATSAEKEAELRGALGQNGIVSKEAAAKNREFLDAVSENAALHRTATAVSQDLLGLFSKAQKEGVPFARIAPEVQAKLGALEKIFGQGIRVKQARGMISENEAAESLKQGHNLFANLKAAETFFSSQPQKIPHYVQSLMEVFDRVRETDASTVLQKAGQVRDWTATKQYVETSLRPVIDGAVSQATAAVKADPKGGAVAARKILSQKIPSFDTAFKEAIQKAISGNIEVGQPVEVQPIPGAPVVYRFVLTKSGDRLGANFLGIDYVKQSAGGALPNVTPSPTVSPLNGRQ